MDIKKIVGLLLVLAGILLRSIVGIGLIAIGVVLVFYKQEVDERAISNGFYAVRVGFIVLSVGLAMNMLGAGIDQGVVFASGMLAYIGSYYLYEKGIL